MKFYGGLIFIIIFSSLIIASDNSANSNIGNTSAIEASEASHNLPFNPVLNDYQVNKSTEIWSASEPSIYITPEDEVVRWYSKHTILKKVNESIYIIQYEDGAPLQPNYVRDQDQFGAEDYWVRPSYYLAHAYQGKRLSGDCEDAAIAMTSILIAKGYDSIAILGYVKKNDGTAGRHAWAETKIEGKIYVVDFSYLYEKSYFQMKQQWTPRYMWNDVITFRVYSPDWH